MGTKMMIQNTNVWFCLLHNSIIRPFLFKFKDVGMTVTNQMT